MLNWDDLRVFLCVERTGRLAHAARQLRIDQSTVSRRLAALENALGARLLDRTPRGVQLTGAGAALLAHAERMETEVISAGAGLTELSGTIRGVVRISTPETFGTSILAPNVAKLALLHPELQIELVPESRFAKLANRDADLAVTLRLPEAGPVSARRIADYRLGLYAHRSYLAENGTPRSVSELRGHRMVGYIDDLIDLPELNVSETTGLRTVFRSTSSIAQLAAVAGGIGIGWLHAYVAEQDTALVRVLEAVDERRSYWLAVHNDQRQVPAVRAAINFVDELCRTYLGSPSAMRVV